MTVGPLCDLSLALLERVGIRTGHHRVEYRRLSVVDGIVREGYGRRRVVLGAICLPHRAGGVVLGFTGGDIGPDSLIVSLYLLLQGGPLLHRLILCGSGGRI